MIDFPLRTDEYSRNFYIVQNGKFKLIPYHVGDYCSHNIARCERSGFWSCFMSPEGKMLHNFQGKRIIIVTERVLLLFVTASCSGVHYI